MKCLYPDSAPKIQAKEAALHLSFTKHFDQKQPKYWLVIPQKFKVLGPGPPASPTSSGICSFISFRAFSQGKRTLSSEISIFTNVRVGSS